MTEYVVKYKGDNKKDEEQSFTVDPNTTTMRELAKLAIKDLDDKKSFSIHKDGKLIYKNALTLRIDNKLDQTLSDHEKNSSQPPKHRPKMTRMFFPTSGRSGFSFYQGDNDDQKYQGKLIDRDVLMKMYLRENELRLSESIQEEMDQCQMNDDDAYALLLDNLQKTVLREFGFKGSNDDVMLFRQGLNMYPEDKELKSIPLYSKFNRARDGEMKIGDPLKDATLCTIENANEKVSLVDFYKQQCIARMLPENSPLVIIAGSIT